MVTDEAEARVRLGTWLAAEPGRTWDSDSGGGGHWAVWLYDRIVAPDDPEFREPNHVSTGDGPTLADAILSALESAHA